MTGTLNMRHCACALHTIAWISAAALALMLAGCSVPNKSTAESARQPVVSETTGPKVASPSAVRTYDIPRFVINSPFGEKYESPVPEKTKRLWARSYLWEKAPDFVVEKWLTEQPDTEGKYLLIEFWATWCRQCRLAVPRLNQFHQKFGNELVVIGISDEKEDVVRKLKEPKIEYYIAIDTEAGTKEKMGVFGIPHAVILEPDGYVVWEGFPLLKGHELTEEVIEKILEVGRNRQTGAGSGS